MAQPKIPNPLDRRHLIEKELPAERALALAEAYLEEGRTEEAVVSSTIDSGVMIRSVIASAI